MNQFHFSALLDTFYMDQQWNTVDKMEILSKAFLSAQVQHKTSMLNFADKNFKLILKTELFIFWICMMIFFSYIYVTILKKYLLLSFGFGDVTFKKTWIVFYLSLFGFFFHFINSSNLQMPDILDSCEYKKTVLIVASKCIIQLSLHQHYIF